MLVVSERVYSPAEAAVLFKGAGVAPETRSAKGTRSSPRLTTECPFQVEGSTPATLPEKGSGSEASSEKGSEPEASPETVSELGASSETESAPEISTEIEPETAASAAEVYV